jgi:hypothetical protein
VTESERFLHGPHNSRRPHLEDDERIHVKVITDDGEVDGDCVMALLAFLFGEVTAEDRQHMVEYFEARGIPVR